MHGDGADWAMTQRKLRDADRAFFALVAEATFSNPFGQRRDELDRKMARTYAAPGGGPDLPRVLAHLEARLGALEVRSGAALGAYGPGDRALLENAALFQIFHQFADALDDFIVGQVRAGVASAPA